MAISDVQEYAHLSDADVEAIGAAFDQIRADVEAARADQHGVVRRTPVEPSRVLAEDAGGPVHLKCENLQRTGSFKIRGAYNFMASLPEEDRWKGVVTCSAG